MKKFLIRFFIGIAGIITAVFSPINVFAIDETFFSSNDILFYYPGSSSCSTTSGGSGTIGSYHNPVYDGNAADPTAIAGTDGSFYTYVTGGDLLQSSDFSKWKKIDGNWKLKGAPNEAGGAKWAPDVAKVGSKYVLTYTIPTGTSEIPAGGHPRIAYAVGDSPGGSFTYKGTLNLSSSGYDIDSHIFVDDDGKAWLFYGGGFIDVIQVSLTGDQLTTVGSAKHILTKGGVGSSGATIEGSWVYKHNGYYYLMYSQGSYKYDGSPAYRVLIARSKTVDGGYQPNNSMKPILEGNSAISHPGHNSVITDANGNDWIVYHGYTSGDGSTRKLLIDPITYENDWPVINDGKGPSSTQHEGSGSVVSSTATTMSTTGSSGTNKDYAGNTILTADELSKINQYQSTYQQAASSAGIPWQMLAALHYRETRLGMTNPGNGDGLYQIVSKSYPAGPVSAADFLQESKDAAEFLKGKTANPDKLSEGDAGTIKDVFFGYNGRSAKYTEQAHALGFTDGYDGSPYVVNRLDLKRDPTVEPTKSNNTWGQVKRDYGPIEYPANSDYGAYVVASSLGNFTGTGSTTSSCTDGSNTGSDGSGSSNGGSGTGATPGSQGWSVTGPNKMTMYYQCESPWKDQWYGKAGDTTNSGTICTCACGPSSMANAITNLNHDNKITPKTMADYFYAHGGQIGGGHCGSNHIWASKPQIFKKDFGINITYLGTDITKVPAAIKRGSFVLMAQGVGLFTSGGHIMLIRGVTDKGNFLVATSSHRDQTENENGYTAKQITAALNGGFYEISR